MDQGPAALALLQRFEVELIVAEGAAQLLGAAQGADLDHAATISASLRGVRRSEGAGSARGSGAQGLRTYFKTSTTCSGSRAVAWAAPSTSFKAWSSASGCSVMSGLPMATA